MKYNMIAMKTAVVAVFGWCFVTTKGQNLRGQGGGGGTDIAARNGGNRTLAMAANASGGGNRTLTSHSEEDDMSDDFYFHRLLQRELQTNDEFSLSLGGGGGRTFSRVDLQEGSSIALRTGRLVDAIILNGVRRGGTGGSATNTLTLRPGEYINSFEIRSGSVVDFIRFTTNQGRSVGGGGGGGRRVYRDQIKVTGIAGKSGSKLDRIQIFFEPNENAIRTVRLGGTGGSEFAEQGVFSLGLKGGRLVDALFLNNERKGGGGGGTLTDFDIQPGEFINSFSVRSGRLIDNLRFSTNFGKSISAGGLGGTETFFDGVRLVSIGGRSGRLLDQVTITYIDNYNPSSLIESGVSIFMNARSEGEFTEFTSSGFTKTQSVQKTMDIAITAGAEGEFFGTTSSNIQTSFAAASDVFEELAVQQEQSSTSLFVVDDGQALIQLTTGDVFRTPDGRAWVVPTAVEPRYDEMGPEGLAGFLQNGKKVVDLGGFVRSITGHETVAKLDPVFHDGNPGAPFDVYIAV